MLCETQHTHNIFLAWNISPNTVQLQLTLVTNPNHIPSLKFYTLASLGCLRFSERHTFCVFVLTSFFPWKLEGPLHNCQKNTSSFTIVKCLIFEVQLKYHLFCEAFFDLSGNQCSKSSSSTFQKLSTCSHQNDHYYSLSTYFTLPRSTMGSKGLDHVFAFSLLLRTYPWCLAQMFIKLACLTTKNAS